MMTHSKQPVSRAELEELEGVIGPLHQVVDWGLALKLQDARRKLPGFPQTGGTKFEPPEQPGIPRIKKHQAMKLAKSATTVYLLSIRLDKGFMSRN
jgi:hypothetical protein